MIRKTDNAWLGDVAPASARVTTLTPLEYADQQQQQQEQEQGGQTTEREEAKQRVAALVNEFLQQVDRGDTWLASQVGVARMTIYRIRTLKVLPDPETCGELARVMHVSPEKLLIAAGYLPPPAPLPSMVTSAFPLGGGDGDNKDNDRDDNGSSNWLTQLDALADPELGFYLSQLGKMSEKTQEIVKTILREEYRQLAQHSNSTTTTTAKGARPAFARKPKARAEKEGSSN